MRACAVEAHVQDFTRATFCGNLKAEMLRPKISPKREHPFCATLCEPAHVKISQEPLYAEIYRKNAAPQNHGADFGRACAVETHVKISQEPLYAEIYSKMPRPRVSTLVKHPAFTPTVRNPQCGHTVWGNLGFYTLSCQQQNT